uniref:Uncharacterized protein n=1 Tax=Trypanosoma congolense (strain IL3000) TaxID=1068625 RepID=G0UNT6_TRYCI|nr:conserved hypothetical protein [Trypanosoma congolense IL3000]
MFSVARLKSHSHYFFFLRTVLIRHFMASFYQLVYGKAMQRLVSQATIARRFGRCYGVLRHWWRPGLYFYHDAYLVGARFHSHLAVTPPLECDDSDFVNTQWDDVVGDGRGTALQMLSEELPVIGVTREVVAPVEQELSRFNIALASPRGDQGEVRSNSRAVSKCEEGGSLTETEQPDPARERPPLPYDDEGFAEVLLEMEVEGSIDEVWQDGRKAHMEDVKEIASVLRSMKVWDICAIDVTEKTSNFDYMVFGTCEGPRHVHLAAWAVQEADALKRVSKIKRKQVDHMWEVVPVGRIIVNLMQESLREELSLERKWTVTKSMDPLSMANAAVSEGRSVRAHGLWTLTLNLQDLEDFEVDYCKDVLLAQI